ncbi:LysR substrate-binding domain-containing protein [Paraburkholderia azotifigens]
MALDQPLPLAVFSDPCIYRESAITALNKADRAWRLAFESSSMAGCLSAASSGFAVTVIADSQRVEGLRLLGRKEGLPALPVVRFYAFPRSDSPACADLIDAARSAGQQGRFSPRALRG